MLGWFQRRKARTSTASGPKLLADVLEELVRADNPAPLVAALRSQPHLTEKLVEDFLGADLAKPVLRSLAAQGGGVNASRIRQVDVELREDGPLGTAGATIVMPLDSMLLPACYACRSLRTCSIRSCNSARASS